MKKTLTLLSLLFLSSEAFCCITCNREIREKLYDDTFLPNLLVMLSAFFVVAALTGILAYFSAKKHTVLAETNPGILNPVPLSTAAMVLGIGVGGFLDGIVLHQILQWHEMLSNRIPPDTLVGKSVNMFWDGIFHFFTLTVVLTGIVLLWKLLHRENIDRSGRLLAGGMLFGWGLFNIVEGLIDHHWLKLHNVKEITASLDAWNFGFLGISAVMLAAGHFIMRRRRG